MSRPVAPVSETQGAESSESSASSGLSARGLTLGFVRPDRAPAVAVSAVDLELRAGETLALVGESGSGKSLTALALLRLLPPACRILDGRLELAGENLLARPEAAMRSIRGGRVAMIFQEPGTSLNPVMTVGQQIGEVLALHRQMFGETARVEARRLLDAVGIADAAQRLDEYAFQLSGGMKQRVMIAMALAGEPDVLLADEPTTALDVTVQAQILTLLRDIQRQRGMAMLLITHDLGIVARMADRVGVMYAGELVEVADRAAFMAAPRHPYTRALVDALPEADRRGRLLRAIPGQPPAAGAHIDGCRFAARCPLAEARCTAESPAWTALSSTHRARCWRLDVQSDAAESELSGVNADAPPGAVPVLDIQNLAVHFPIRRGVFRHVVGQVKAVDGVSLSVPAGRTLALVGESGCGKTTVGKAALALTATTRGEIRLDGAIPAAGDKHWRKKIQMVFQDPFSSLNPKRSVGEILREGMDALEIGAPAGRPARIAELLLEVGLDAAMATRYPHEFSGGQRQRIAIARALAVQPAIIVCDEPTSALDVSVQAQILNLMRRLQREHNVAYLFITHNLAVVEYLADEVAVMYLGRIVESGTAESILRTPAHPYTQALLAAVPKFSIQSADDFLDAGLRGEVPSPSNPPAGCHFHPRCPKASAICRETSPQASQIAGQHQVRCHFPTIWPKSFQTVPANRRHGEKLAAAANEQGLPGPDAGFA